MLNASITPYQAFLTAANEGNLVRVNELLAFDEVREAAATNSNNALRSNISHLFDMKMASVEREKK